MSLGHGASIVRDELVLCLDAANTKSYKNYNLATYSQDFSNVAWTKSTGLITASSLLAPDGTLTATTLTDDLNNAYEFMSRSFTVLNNSSSYNISIYIKKTTGGTSTRTGFNVSFTGGTTKSYNIRFNADTGVATGGDSNSSTSENNDYWRLSFVVSNNSTGNTTMSMQYYPATGLYNSSDSNTAIGSHTVWGFQITNGATLLPYKTNVTDSVTTWLDLSGNENNGTLINSPAYSISTGAAIVFNGTNQIASVSNNATINAGTGDCSVDVWCKANTLHNTGISHRIIAKGASSDVDPGWCIVVNNGSIFASVCASTTRVGPSGGSFAANEWLHFTMVISRLSGITTYKNGVVTGNVAVGAGTLTGTQPLTVGGLTGGNYFDGSISHCKVYNRALIAAEVSQNFSALKGRYGI